VRVFALFFYGHRAHFEICLQPLPAPVRDRRVSSWNRALPTSETISYPMRTAFRPRARLHRSL